MAIVWNLGPSIIVCLVPLSDDQRLGPSIIICVALLSDDQSQLLSTAAVHTRAPSTIAAALDLLLIIAL